MNIEHGQFAPVLIKCGKPAKLYGMAALCDSCADQIIKKETS